MEFSALYMPFNLILIVTLWAVGLLFCICLIDAKIVPYRGLSNLPKFKNLGTDGDSCWVWSLVLVKNVTKWHCILTRGGTLDCLPRSSHSMAPPQGVFSVMMQRSGMVSTVAISQAQEAPVWVPRHPFSLPPGDDLWAPELLQLGLGLRPSSTPPSCSALAPGQCFAFWQPRLLVLPCNFTWACPVPPPPPSTKGLLAGVLT